MLGNIFILGDSYSTFTGYIPEGHGAYYRPEGPRYMDKDPEYVLNESDVTKVEETWWHDLANENGKLVLNCSWSGTTICNTGYDGSDNSRISFIARFEKLFAKGFFEENKIETFFLFGGTNDSWADSPLGEPMRSGWKTEDLYNVLPAFSYLMEQLTAKLQDAKIYCIINDGLKDEITDFYKSVCEEKGVDYIELCGIEKFDGHPTIDGMRQIKEQVLAYIKEKQNI